MKIPALTSVFYLTAFQSIQCVYLRYILAFFSIGFNVVESCKDD